MWSVSDEQQATTISLIFLQTKQTLLRLFKRFKIAMLPCRNMLKRWNISDTWIRMNWNTWDMLSMLSNTVKTKEAACFRFFQVCLLAFCHCRSFSWGSKGKHGKTQKTRGKHKAWHSLKPLKQDTLDKQTEIEVAEIWEIPRNTRNTNTMMTMNNNEYNESCTEYKYWSMWSKSESEYCRIPAEYNKYREIWRTTGEIQWILRNTDEYQWIQPIQETKKHTFHCISLGQTISANCWKLCKPLCMPSERQPCPTFSPPLAKHC